jgi:hypothetical protein
MEYIIKLQPNEYPKVEKYSNIQFDKSIIEISASNIGIMGHRNIKALVYCEYKDFDSKLVKTYPITLVYEDDRVIRGIYKDKIQNILNQLKNN